jgi:hypothetical protein
MAAGQGNKIEWSDYNAIQSVIAPVLGATPTASGNTGYGQSVASNQVTQYAKITNTQWANLRTDILRARQHQTGTDLTSTLAVPYFEIIVTQTAINTNLLTTSSTSQLAVNCPVMFIGASLLGGVQTNYTYYVKTIDSSTTFTISSNQGGGVFALSTGIGSMTCRFGGTKITETDRAAYKAAADQAALSKLSGATGPSSLPATQSTRETLYNDSYINAWNGVLSVVSTVQFTSFDAARYFFNARGQVEITSSRTGGSGGLKNATWTTMLDNVSGMGIIYFTYATTVNLLTNGNNGSGTASSLGFYNLTTSDQLLFEKLAPSGAYADNKFRIYAKLVDGNGGAGSNSAIQFTLQWRDESANPNPTQYGPYGPFGIDENVDGVISSIIQILRPTGSNVSLSAPTTGIANNFAVTAIASNTISYTITPNTTTTNEGTTVNYTITTVNVPNNAIIYWTNSGSTSAADFVSGANSGSITIQNNSASLSLSISNDQITEGPENIQIVLRTGSVAGPIVATSSITVVDDTSLTPVTYSITSSPAGQQDEGTTITYTVTTQYFGNGVLFWYNAGTTVGADFTDGSNSGSVTITQNSGSFDRTIRKDALTEGTETIIMQLRVNSPNGTTVATANTITVSDTSTTLLPSYVISTTLYSNGSAEPVNEGDTFNVYVDTNAAVSSSPIYWNWSGITKERLGLSVLYGVMSITPGSRSAQTFVVRSDGITEGTTNAYLNFYSDAGFGTLLSSASVGGTVSGNARTIQINDTSTALTISPFLLNPPTAGSNYNTTFTASNGSGIYAFLISGGTPIPGTSIDTNGNLSGVVTYGGSYNFTVGVRDSNSHLGTLTYSGSINANEVVTTGTYVSSTTNFYYRVDYGDANTGFTINGNSYSLDARGTYWGYGNFGGVKTTTTFTFIFNGSGHVRTVTITSY